MHANFASHQLQLLRKVWTLGHRPSETELKSTNKTLSTHPLPTTVRGCAVVSLHNMVFVWISPVILARLLTQLYFLGTATKNVQSTGIAGRRVIWQKKSTSRRSVTTNPLLTLMCPLLPWRRRAGKWYGHGSLALRNLRYTTFIGDGDTKTFNAITDLQPYGPGVQIERQTLRRACTEACRLEFEKAEAGIWKEAPFWWQTTWWTWALDWCNDR